MNNTMVENNKPAVPAKPSAIKKESFKFGDNLFGKAALDSVLQLNLTEIKLLEQVELYSEKRAHLDMEYAEKLGKLHDRMKLTDINVYNSGSLLDKAWRTFMNESENKAITMLSMTKLLNQQIVPRIKTLIARRKEVLENFKSCRVRIEKDFNWSSEEVTRLQNTYKNALRQSSRWKNKIDESYQKAKGQRDWHKSKERLDHASRSLHMNHNEYFLSLAALNKHQKYHNEELIPHLLDSMQDVQQRLVQPWKEIFVDIQYNTSWCREEFITSEKEVKQSLDLIESEKEYNGFINANKKPPAPLLPHFFDTTLVKDRNATSGLTEDSLAINDLTHIQLENKKKELSDKQSDLDAAINSKKENYNEQKRVLQEMSAGEHNKAIYSTIEQCINCQNLHLEVKEAMCKAGLNEVQYDWVETSLRTVEDSGPRPYIELNPPSKSQTTPRKLPKSENSTPVNGDTKQRSSTLLGKLRKRPVSTVVTEERQPQRPPSSCSDESYEEPYESLEFVSWFHGKIDRVVGARLLKNDGDFIVRERSDESGDIVLCVLWKGKTKHFILKPDDQGKYKLEADSFHNIPALINHHHEKRIVIQASTGIILVNAIKRPFFSGDAFTVPHDNVQLDRKLGGGHFGEVYLGVLLSKNRSIAVKTCRENVDAKIKTKFLEEAKIMKPCVHPNVVELIGVCNDHEPYYIIMELCAKGDLLNVLKKEGVRLEVRDLYHMALNTAEGMAYLEKMQIIHRDLAARNCLVTKDNVVKISDFGMSREEDNEGIYTIHSTKEIPFKWCAPEIWHYTTYSTKSDVWAYGVTLWEIFSLGSTPYSSWNNRQTREQIDKGYRLPPPSGTPPQIFEIMQRCWNANDSLRPHFSEIVITLGNMREIFGD